jgi:septal ring factor EnvC (AmiA/AmiB activator)
MPGYNKCVFVRHGSYITAYANLVSTSVRKGARVAAGQTLGHIGGNSDDNALHFEIRHELTPLDPEQWLKR